ncbi:MAG TPA: HAMP domain-containing sensor histidine kinase [Ktedonobacterales bacterium]|nr:HAMP domain-containing sensor histidine kinase [Ktedonobacterales bacterium]
MSNQASEGARVGDRRMRSRLHETSLSMPRPHMPRWLRPPTDVADPSTTMFQRIRRSMTLLYITVLAVTLLLAGGVLYLAAQHFLMDSTLADLNRSAQQTASAWGSELASTNLTPCNFQGPDHSFTLVACYSGSGALTGASQLAVSLSPFTTDTPLIRRALASPSDCAVDQIATSQDTTGGPPGYGIVEREACVARSSTNAVVGVVLVGAPIEDSVRALHQLLILLLIVGGFTVAVSALGGFILSARAMAPARLAYERQQRFIGDVSHELRTPLTLLRADAEMLLRGRARLPEDDAELLDDIVDETARLATLTTSLLTLARLDSGNHLPEREMIDLAEVAANVARRTAAFAGDRQVPVRPVATDGLYVNGVRDLIDQAALILVDNAIKYNRPGGQVEVRAERRGERVALIVQDDGPGVAPEHLERLGERFYRPDKARARQSGQDGGAGLGISIARSVAALHGGALNFTSAPGHGLTATVELPAAKTRHTPLRDETTDEEAPEPHGATYP